MPPAPEPLFVSDSQAWTSMASQLSYAVAARQGAGAETEGSSPRTLPVATTAARSGDDDDWSCPSDSGPPSARRRRRQASLPQRLPCRDDEEGSLIRGASEPTVTENVSNSFTAPNDDRNRRPEISGMMRQQSFHSMSSLSSGDSHKKCQVHPQVRMRSSRCPRCAAWDEMTKERKKSLGNAGMADVDDVSDVGSVAATVIGNDKSLREDEQGVHLCQHAMARVDGNNTIGVLDEIHDTTVTTTDISHEVETYAQEATEHEYVEEEVEEVSLDEKWANALRFISQRLADQKSQGNSSEACTSKTPSAPTNLDHELQQTIERAAKSIGIYSIDSYDEEKREEVDEHYETEEEDGDYNDFSESSLARECGTPATKKIAESKGGKQHSPPPSTVVQHTVADALSGRLEHSAPTPNEYIGMDVVASDIRSCRSSGSHPDALSQGLERSAPKADEFVGTEVMTSNISLSLSSGSDSSVTLSVESSSGHTQHTMGSYNSLSAPAPSSKGATLGLTRSNETYDSPSCVIHNVDRDYCCDKTDYQPRTEEVDFGEPQEEEEEEQDFEHSFFMAVPKVYAEEKTTAPRITLDVSRGDIARDQSYRTLGAKEHDDTARHRSSMLPEYSLVRDRSSYQQSDDARIEDPRTNTLTIKSCTSPPRSNTKENQQPLKKDVQATQVLIEDVTFDESSDDDEIPSASSSPSKAVPSSPPSPIKPPPANKKSPGPSFFSALVHNSRSRSQSRPRSKSQSRPRSKSRGRRNATVGVDNDQVVSRPRRGKSKSKNSNGVHKNIDEKKKVQRKKERERDDSMTVVPREGKPRGRTPQPSQEAFQQEVVAQKIPEEFILSTKSPPGTNVNVRPVPSQTDSTSLRRDRGPITHPHYKLGDFARAEDMLVFPEESKSRHRARSRRSRRRRKRDHEGSGEDDGSSCSESDDDDVEKSPRSKAVDVTLAIGQLGHLDAAFVRRSDGQWTYALVADGDSTQLRFVVNDRGSTKSFPRSLWKSCVRRIRVLTPRRGDRFAVSGKPGRKKRSIGRSRSRGKGRLVSPSPKRRNSSVLNLPPTIMEGRE